MPPGIGYAEDGDELMGGMGALMEMSGEEEPADPEKAEKKPASNFDLAADRVFKALGSQGDSAGFRSSLRSAIKIIVSDMT